MIPLYGDGKSPYNGRTSVWIFAILIVIALLLVGTSTDDPAVACQNEQKLADAVGPELTQGIGFLNHFWFGGLVLFVFFVLPIRDAFDGPNGCVMVVLALALFGGVLYYMYGVRGW
jgi:hypothetical protein